MARRVHIPSLCAGQIELPPAQAAHLRDVLRLKAGDCVEAFDDAGSTAEARIISATNRNVTVEVGAIELAQPRAFCWTIASAVPKGPRADWMVEKLSELGTSLFIPLTTARSVVETAGKEKPQRWSRLAAEAARQSGRQGVMRIAATHTLDDLLKSSAEYPARWFFSTRADAIPLARFVRRKPPSSLLMLIGPEGGWTDAEIEKFQNAKFTAVKLAETILRIETAAIAAAAGAASWQALDASGGDGDDLSRS